MDGRRGGPISVSPAKLLGLTLLYLLAAKLGLSFAAISPSATAVWPPSGIAFAACLLLGQRVWPAIFVGAFLTNVTTAGSVATSLGIAAGNTLEAVLGAYLVQRWANGPKVFDRARDLFRFVGLAALASTAVSATIGVTTLALAGFAPWAAYGSIWLTWWLGDAAGDLIFAPLLVLWVRNRSVGWRRRRVFEAAVLLGSMTIVGVGIFARPWPLGHFSLAFLCLPPLLWAAFRFGPRGAAAVTVLMSAIAVWGTRQVFDTVPIELRNDALIMLQVLMATISVTALSVAALVWERRRADQARGRLAAIVESSDDAIASKTLDGAITSWNPAAERMFGWTAAEAVGRPIILIIPEDRRDEENEVLARIRRGDAVDHFETVRVARDGRRLDVSVTVSPVKDAAGRIIGASSMVRDITAYKRGVAERAALLAAERQAQEHLRTVVESMAAPVTRCSRDLRYLWVSRAYAEWLGRRAEDIVGCPIVDVIGQGAFTAIRPHIERVLRGERVEYEEPISFNGPGLRWIHAVYTPTLDPAGRPDGWVAVVVDVDPQRRAEEALARLLAEAQAARHEAEAATRARDEFLAMLGHELRNPLGAIASALSLIRLVGRNDSPPATRALDVMSRQVSHLSRYMDDLLDAARVMGGKVSLVRGPLDLGAEAERAAATIEATVPGRKVVRTCESVWVDADVTRIEQIVVNLLSNALKFTTADDTVELRVTTEQDTAVLTVTDTGAGIAPELLPRVFDLFVQAGTSPHRSQGGLGIGLTLVRKLVELHGGSVEAGSAGSGQGSTFIVRLPCVCAPAATPEPTWRDVQPRARRRILVIDDDADGRDMIAAHLRLGGHDIQEAADGVSGIESAQRYHPEIAIIDIGLPGADGYAVARALRNEGQTIPLVALTGYGQPEDRQRARKAGFDSHLTKPVDPLRLMELIDELTAREPRAAD
jgi:PAS domain S-box-containing protein